MIFARSKQFNILLAVMFATLTTAFATFATFATTVVANTVAPAQNSEPATEIEEHTKNQAVPMVTDCSKKDLAASNKKLELANQELANITRESEPVVNKYIETKRSLETLRNKVKASPTLELRSKIKNEELKFILIESEYDDIARKKLEIEETLEVVQTDIAKTSKKIAGIEKRIDQRQQAVKQAKLSENRRETEKLAAEAAALKQADTQAKLEIERLKQLLAAKEEQIATANSRADKASEQLTEFKQTVQEQATVSSVTPNEANKIEETGEANEISEANTASESVSTADIAATGAAINSDTNSDTNFNTEPAAAFDTIDVNSKAYAQQALKRFNDNLTLKGLPNRGSKDNRIVRANRADTNRRAKPIALSPRGNFQYKGKLKLKGGKYVLQVGGFSTEAEIPEDDSLNTYVVLFDNRPGQTPRLDLFKKSLLN